MTWSTFSKVWFGCKVCSKTFSNLDSFIEHKIQNHWGRLDKIRSIVLEENTVYLDGDDDGDDQQGIFIARENAEVLAPERNTNFPLVPQLQGEGDANKNSINHHDNTEAPVLQEGLQLLCTTSNYAELESNGSISPESDTNSNFENELICTPPNLYHDSNAEPDIAIKNMQTDIIVTNQMDKNHEGISPIPENNVWDFPILINRFTSAEIQAPDSTNINCTATNATKSSVIASDHIQENPNPQAETNIETRESSNSSDTDFALEDNSSSNTFVDTLFEPEPKFQLNLDASCPFVEPKIELTVLDDDIDVDMNVGFLPRHSPLVPLKRLTPQEIKDAAAGKIHFLNNSVSSPGRQLPLDARNQDDEDDVMEFNGEAEASLLNSDGTGSRFLDDCYEVKNKEGHIVFKPNNIEHENVDPPLGETSIVCTLCKFVTDSKANIKNHMRIHSISLMCSHVDCFASFDFQPSLQRHYGDYHSPLKPFRCSYDDCYKAYQTLLGLKFNLMGHTGERPFRCTHKNCPSEFKTKNALFRHTSKVHSNERSFKCPRIGLFKSILY